MEAAMKSMAQMLQKLSQRDNAAIFNHPVSALEYPDYHQIVLNPMDLGTILGKLQREEYSSMKACAKDVRLVWTNAYLYNPEGSIVADAAQKLSKAFENMYNKINPDDFNYDREPNLEERQKFSRDIYRVEDSQLAEALDMLEARCPEGVIRNNEEGYVVVKVDTLPSPVFWEAELFLKSRLCNQPERTKKKIPTTLRATPEYVAARLNSAAEAGAVYGGEGGNNAEGSDRNRAAGSNGGGGNRGPGGGVTGESDISPTANNTIGSSVAGNSSGGRGGGSIPKKEDRTMGGGVGSVPVVKDQATRAFPNGSGGHGNSTTQQNFAQNRIHSPSNKTPVYSGGGGAVHRSASSIKRSDNYINNGGGGAGSRYARDSGHHHNSILASGSTRSQPGMTATSEFGGQAGGDNVIASRSNLLHAGVDGGLRRGGHATGWARGPSDAAFREKSACHKRQKIHGGGV